MSLRPGESKIEASPALAEDALFTGALLIRS
jgi:hypothetical protein